MLPLDVVVFTTRDWWEYQRRPHYTVLSKYVRVLVVELPINLVTVFRDTKKVEKYLQGKLNLRQQSSTLYVYTPFSFMPYGLGYRKDWLSSINSKSFSMGL